jgi:prolyl-tRNA synthetase
LFIDIIEVVEEILVMRMSELIGERYKEKPADCTVESHALMVRGG